MTLKKEVHYLHVSIPIFEAKNQLDTIVVKDKKISFTLHNAQYSASHILYPMSHMYPIPPKMKTSTYFCL